MERAPKISIIVPVFNCEDYLDHTLGTLYTQSYKDFEVIISDDASTDRSAKIAKQWQSKDPRFKLFEHAHNVGMTQNWNQARQYVSGDYIMKLDADDGFQIATLEQLIAAVSSDNTDIAFCRTLECNDELAIQNTYRGEQALINAGINPAVSCTKSSQEWYQLTLADAQLWHSNAFIIPTALMNSLGGWNEQFGCASDTDLIFRLLEQDLNIAHINYLGVLYRMHEGSISHEFRQNDTLIDENYASSLGSVRRYYDSGKALNYKAKLNWYRIHQNAQARYANNSESDQAMNFSTDIALNQLPMHVAILGKLQRSAYDARKFLLNLIGAHK